MSETREFIALNIAVLTISDSREASNDKSGDLLVRHLTEDGHQLSQKSIVDGSQMNLFKLFSPLEALASLAVTALQRLSLRCLIRLLKALVKCFAIYPMTRLAPLHYSQGLWPGLLMALTCFACPGHQEPVRMPGLS
jgi:hypothetical protein